MQRPLDTFESITRRTHFFTDHFEASEPVLHAFDRRNIHPGLPRKVRKLFDDGHYADATFAAFKYLEKLVQKHSGCGDSGEKLMLRVFDNTKPLLKLTTLASQSEVDEQRGFRFLFSGGVVAIRNPRGHEVDMPDDVDTCLDHLAFTSLLIRRLELAGFAR